MSDPILPPAPPNAVQAIALANQLAYGFEKHTDPNYWNRYASDPDYFWKRMLGWQAGGADVARFGLYAVPPSDWHRIVIVPDVPPVVPPVIPDAPHVGTVIALLADLAVQSDRNTQKVLDALGAVEKRVNSAVRTLALAFRIGH